MIVAGAILNWIALFILLYFFNFVCYTVFNVIRDSGWNKILNRATEVRNLSFGDENLNI